MYKLASTPDWKKGIKVWQLVFGVEDSDIFEGEKELETSYCTPKPEVDLKRMKKEKCIIANLPESVLKVIRKNQDQDISQSGNYV